MDADSFAQTARQFCALIDEHELHSLHQFIKRVAELLAMLYQGGLALPDVGGDATDDGDEWLNTSLIRQSLASRLGLYNFYWEVFDPFELDEPVAGEIADDLADIYQEVKIGLMIFEKNSSSSIDGAVWHWKFGFSTHWGDHAVNALRAVHRLRFRLEN